MTAGPGESIDRFYVALVHYPVFNRQGISSRPR